MITESFKQAVMEVFSQPYETWALYKTENRTEVFFETEAGNEYKVKIGHSLAVDGAIELGFSMRGNGAEWSSDITEAGDQFRVLATVVKVASDYLEKYKPKTIVFRADASQPTRVKLYKRLAQYVESAFGYKRDKSLTTMEDHGMNFEVFLFNRD